MKYCDLLKKDKKTKTKAKTGCIISLNFLSNINNFSTSNFNEGELWVVDAREQARALSGDGHIH